jgi:hypothetical protein
LLFIPRDLHSRDCRHFSISMSLDASHFAMTCSGPDIPYTCIHRTQTNKLISVYDTNQKLADRIEKVDLPTQHFLQVNKTFCNTNLIVTLHVYSAPLRSQYQART